MQRTSKDSSFTISVTFIPEVAGSFDGKLTFTSNDPNENAYSIILLGTALDRADFSVSPESIDHIIMFNDIRTDSLLFIYIVQYNY